MSDHFIWVNGKHDFKIGNIFKFTFAIEETLTMF